MDLGFRGQVKTGDIDMEAAYKMVFQTFLSLITSHCRHFTEEVLRKNRQLTGKVAMQQMREVIQPGRIDVGPWGPNTVGFP